MVGDFVVVPSEDFGKVGQKIQIFVISDCQSKIASYKKGSAFNSSNICHIYV